MSKDNLIDGEKEFYIKKLEAELKELGKENDKLKLLLKEADPEASADMVSDSEYICIKQIAKLKEYAKERDLTSDEVKAFDTLHKNLNIIHGKNPRKIGGNKSKQLSIEELEELANKGS